MSINQNLSSCEWHIVISNVWEKVDVLAGYKTPNIYYLILALKRVVNVHLERRGEEGGGRGWGVNLLWFWVVQGILHEVVQGNPAWIPLLMRGSPALRPLRSRHVHPACSVPWTEQGPPQPWMLVLPDKKNKWIVDDNSSAFKKVL